MTGGNPIFHNVTKTAASIEGDDNLFYRANLIPPEIDAYYKLLQQPPFDAFLFNDELTAIHRQLRKLPPKKGRLCELYFIDDFSYEEIARFTNLSPTTVKNHIAWCMIILRNYMNRPKAPV